MKHKADNPLTFLWTLCNLSIVDLRSLCNMSCLVKIFQKENTAMFQASYCDNTGSAGSGAASDILTDR